ncbi:MAG TPA: glycerol-3-phosphate 1-O-acyltransferase PlsY [Planctomycetes bacterium]|nr:glycerol-3-phosphate 1-O-acyltransferase PlsY [Planctomycetota bacterium]HIK59633.1 glycerol-3-phosphate 1-O-acyltransferase [Planctomycetota bacterium]
MAPLSLIPQTGIPGPLLLAVLASYLLGSVPFGLLLTRALKGEDLRQLGSGNIGATNTMRALGRGWGLVSFALDCAKGWVSVDVIAPALVMAAGDSQLVMCGAAAVLGHCFPVYLGFKGGKGVATACGAIAAIDPLVVLTAGLIWVFTIRLTRYVGLASILMGIGFPVAAWLRPSNDTSLLVGCTLLALLVLVRHRQNISRMLQGTEPRAGQGPKESPGDPNHE